MLHADIADIRFLAKSAVAPKYCLLLVDLFTSKIYLYRMKNRSLLAKELGLLGLLKCFIRNFVEGRVLLQNKKLENLKRFY